MKRTIIAAVIFSVGITTIYFTSRPEEVSYVQPTIATSTIEVVEVDNVTEAQRQLNEAKKLLDTEEQNILSEIATKETRLEEIRKVRLSFSQAPTPVN